MLNVFRLTSEELHDEALNMVESAARRAMEADSTLEMMDVVDAIAEKKCWLMNYQHPGRRVDWLDVAAEVKARLERNAR